MADIVYHHIHAFAYTGTINLVTDVLKVILLSPAYVPDPDHYRLIDINGNEIANGNGYTTNGLTVTGTVADSNTTNATVISINNPIWTASGTGIGPFRYAALYDNTHANKALIYLFDFGMTYTAATGAVITIHIDSNGLFIIS